SPPPESDSRSFGDNVSTISLAGSASAGSCHLCEEALANAQERERILMMELEAARALATKYKNELAESRKTVSRLQEVTDSEIS
ncbi:hypothetical protein PMAYCL1PPCAC_20210, partial [Pristionchus mayeri]